MARRIVLLLLISYGSCMKMRETVERTVMVRTTGSDLQPEATGFIYKRGTNGEAVVTKLGETEVMEQLSKLYEPKSFTGTIPVTGPFAKEQENAELKKEDKVIPVEEKQEDVDGIADEDYRKVIDDYAANFNDYLKDLGHFKDYNKKDYGFDIHHDYDPKDAHDDGHYDTKKYESYYLARDDVPFDKIYGKIFNHKEYNNEDYNYKAPQDHAFLNKKDEEDDKHPHFYGDEHSYGGNTKHDNDQSSEQHILSDGKESDEHNSSKDSEEDSTTHTYADYGPKSGLASSKGYGYEVKH